MARSQWSVGTMNEPELRRCYTYSWPRRTYYGVVGVFCTLFVIPFLTAPIWVTVLFITTESFQPFALLLAGFAALGATAFITFFLNYGQTICISDGYLESRFFYVFWTRIPWEDIVEIRPIVIPTMRGAVVTAKKLTPFHYVLGWQFGQTYQPAVAFTTEIRGYEELLREIHRRSGIVIP